MATVCTLRHSDQGLYFNSYFTANQGISADTSQLIHWQSWTNPQYFLYCLIEGDILTTRDMDASFTHMLHSIQTIASTCEQGWHHCHNVPRAHLNNLKCQHILPKRVSYCTLHLIWCNFSFNSKHFSHVILATDCSTRILDKPRAYLVLINIIPSKKGNLITWLFTCAQDHEQYTKETQQLLEPPSSLGCYYLTGCVGHIFPLANLGHNLTTKEPGLKDTKHHLNDHTHDTDLVWGQALPHINLFHWTIIASFVTQSIPCSLRNLDSPITILALMIDITQ